MEAGFICGLKSGDLSQSRKGMNNIIELDRVR